MVFFDEKRMEDGITIGRGARVRIAQITMLTVAPESWNHYSTKGVLCRVVVFAGVQL